MKIEDWNKIKVITKENDSALKVGEFFLYGDHMINQLSTKNIGDQISYYRVLSSKSGSMSYIPVHDVLTN